jgi:hypothetical protein
VVSSQKEAMPLPVYREMFFTEQWRSSRKTSEQGGNKRIAQ